MFPGISASLSLALSFPLSIIPQRCRDESGGGVMWEYRNGAASEGQWDYLSYAPTAPQTDPFNPAQCIVKP